MVGCSTIRIVNLKNDKGDFIKTLNSHIKSLLVIHEDHEELIRPLKILQEGFVKLSSTTENFVDEKNKIVFLE